MTARTLHTRFRAVGEATIAIVLVLALLPSTAEAKQRTVPIVTAENSKGTAPHAFEPKDVLIEIPRQGKAKGL
jgi:hypothetical protein